MKNICNSIKYLHAANFPTYKIHKCIVYSIYNYMIWWSVRKHWNSWHRSLSNHFCHARTVLTKCSIDSLLLFHSKESDRNFRRHNWLYICLLLAYFCLKRYWFTPACTIERDSRRGAILGVILVLLLREQITTFWRVYHLCTYKRCRKNAMLCFFRTFLQHSTRKVVKILHLF